MMSKSSNRFTELCELIMDQMLASMVFGPAAAGDQGGAIGKVDFYAPGDARVPKFLGARKRKKPLVQRRNLTP